jgi:hypothetical protein
MKKGFLVVGSILTVLDSKRICRIHGLTEEELDEIDARLETSQRKTLAQPAWYVNWHVCIISIKCSRTALFSSM